MKILSISDLSSTGGAAIAGNRISDALKNNGAEVIQLSSDGRNTKEQRVLFSGKKFSALHNLLTPIIPTSYAKSLNADNLNYQFIKLLQQERFDAINIHNLHDAVWPISLVSTALKFAPVIWTLHDCWSFLGSFYPSHCPAPSDYYETELKGFWKFIEHNHAKHTLTAVTPSDWMNNTASSSYWKGCEVRTIRNPVPESFFELFDRESCKRVLGLSLKKSTVLCIAGNLNEERKGGLILHDILTENWDEKVEFLLLGRVDSSIISSDKFKCLGFINDEITIKMAYHAADLVLHPAPVDNLPNTVAESLSCGTPVLAFNTGGLPEMVIPQKSGWLVPPSDHAGMINTLKGILDTKSYSDLRSTSRSTAHEKFHSSKIGKEYQDLFISCTDHK